MAFPSDQLNPREVAAHALASSRWHEVVVASSKAVHAVPLDKEDRDALQWANKVLAQAGSASAAFNMSSAQQLADSGQTLAMLRRATERSRAHAADPFKDVRRALEQVLAGTPNADTLASIAQLRDLFAAVAQGSLRAQVHAQSTTEMAGSWDPSPTNSIS